MQGCKQSGILPAGSEIQVLQPGLLQADVLQDLPGALTPGAPTPGAPTPGGTERIVGKGRGGGGVVSLFLIS